MNGKNSLATYLCTVATDRYCHTYGIGNDCSSQPLTTFFFAWERDRFDLGGAIHDGETNVTLVMSTPRPSARLLKRGGNSDTGQPCCLCKTSDIPSYQGHRHPQSTKGADNASSKRCRSICIGLQSKTDAETDVDRIPSTPSIKRWPQGERRLASKSKTRSSSSASLLLPDQDQAI